MPTDVKLNAEGVVKPLEWEKLQAAVDEPWGKATVLQARGLIEALLTAHNDFAVLDGVDINDLVAVLDARDALAAAHAQHEADEARIGGLEQALRRIVGCYDINHEHQREKLADIIPIARSALAKVKP